MQLLVDQYGELCYLCGGEPTPNDPLNVDHYYPQTYCKSQGWPEEVYNELSNLRPSHMSCNRQKSDTIPHSGWVFTPPEPKTFAPKVIKREPCQLCAEGHLLFPGELCEYCGSGAQPVSWPAVLQRSPKQCDHNRFHCWACGPMQLIPRKTAFQVILQGE
jgi:hypothetical protein